MYVPKHFEEPRVEVLHALIRAPARRRWSRTAGGLVANHIPFEIDPDPAPLGTLRAHVAARQPVWRDAASGGEALVIFQGPDAYALTGLVSDEEGDGKVVPTWNYAVVHAHGPRAVHRRRAWLRAFVEMLTDRHEAGRPDDGRSPTRRPTSSTRWSSHHRRRASLDPTPRQVEGQPEPAGP